MKYLVEMSMQLLRQSWVLALIWTWSIALNAIWPTLIHAYQESPELEKDRRQKIRFFEKSVRPVLLASCSKCHGPKKQWADLRLDTVDGLREGGESGPVVVAGKPEESELLHRVSEEDVDLRMPPAESGPKLTAKEIAVLTHWVKIGAPWPESTNQPTAESRRAAQRSHWAFQPVARPVTPAVKRKEWPLNEIDLFVLSRLEAEEIPPSSAADRRTLIRRATYDLTGLPPTPDEVKEFVQDKSDDAYEKLIDRLLNSSRYGEQWGRHWLDVARYSDVKGYVYTREERRFVHSALYRDWVIQAFNDDLPYDRFVLLQLAADQAADDPRDLAAMGYLTLGRRFLGVTPDIIDDRIDVVGRGLLGLSVGCARCHDHKYDPIPTADYYSLYGVFENSTEDLVPIPRRSDVPPPSEEFEKELAKRKRTLREATAASRTAAGNRVRQKIDQYLLAQRELEKYPSLVFSQLLPPDALFPTIVRRWETYLFPAKKRNDPVFVPWFAFAELADADFSTRAVEVTQQLAKQADKINPRVAAAFAKPPASAAEVAERYQQVLGAVDNEWATLCAEAKAAGKPGPQVMADSHDEALRQVLYGATSPCEIPDVPIVNSEFFWDIETIKRLWSLQKAVDGQILPAPDAAPHAVVLNDRHEITEPRIFRRGDPTNIGETVPRQFLEVLSGTNRQSFATGSGRLEMAQAIVDPENPLTGRVWVNRVWMHHFGAGLVRTPSDFGMRSDPPSHPQLLDWLTSEFIAHGGSTKWLHRTIMLSATYRQASSPPADVSLMARVKERDPANRLLSRMNPRRLTFEQFRDTLLALSGELDLKVGGKSVAMFGQAHFSNRRSVYGLIDREFLPPVLRDHDFANPELHTGRRVETTAPQQALFAMNGNLLFGRARSIVNRQGFANHPLRDEQVRQLYQVVFQRDPSSTELSRAMAFLQPVSDRFQIASGKPEPSVWTYGFGEIDSDAQALKSFSLLPYFTGDAWQGGSSWPDARVGWVQVTAKGGHPGNDLQHAAVRRWTAPDSGRVSLTSEFIHEPQAGDGVRYWVLSSRLGVLTTGVMHQSRKPVNVEAIDVKAGDTLDFVVDINGQLGYDQFLWVPEIQFIDSAASSDGRKPVISNATKGFTEKELARGFTKLKPRDLWGQLVQTLLMSNELIFLD
jgi:hypothetical protein